MIDSKKHSESITLKQILDLLYEPYKKDNPDYRSVHHFFNQYQLISSLYSYLVLPKEAFFNSIQDIQINLLKDSWGINKIIPTCQLNKFIRRIRNAVSHGNIEFTEKLMFTFIDQNPRKEADKFLVELSGDQLLKFTQALAYWCLEKDINLTKL